MEISDVSYYLFIKVKNEYNGSQVYLVADLNAQTFKIVIT